MADLLFLEDIARLDLSRQKLSGIPEVILAEGKLPEHFIKIAVAAAGRMGRVMVSRLDDEAADRLEQGVLEYSRANALSLRVDRHPRAKMAIVRQVDAEAPKKTGGLVGILAAGTSDIVVAEEARMTAEEMGCEVIAHYDVGVATLHRIVEPLREINQRGCAAVIVAAGMEGALPTVVKSLLPMPVIGLPVAVGYGFGGKGEAALMAMLQSCSPGLTVVNINNGFGAGASAALIANQVARATKQA